MAVYGISKMIDHKNMILRNRPQIKSMSLRLYGPKGSPFPRLDKVWDVKIVKNVKICPPFVPITFYSFVEVI
jgi:hypothetical protein